MGRQGLFASVGVSYLLTGSPVISGASRHTGRRKSSMDAPPTVHLRCADGKVVQPMPRVCIYCGQHASETRKESFSWKAAWGVFVDWWVSGPSLGTRRFTIEIPVCKKHSKVIGRAKTLDWVALTCFLIGFAAVLIVDTCWSAATRTLCPSRRRWAPRCRRAMPSRRAARPCCSRRVCGSRSCRRSRPGAGC